MGGGPSDFIVNCSPHLWIFGFETLDFDFCLDKNGHSLFFFVILKSLLTLKLISSLSGLVRDVIWYFVCFKSAAIATTSRYRTKIILSFNSH